MDDKTTIQGIHHITAITSTASENLAFYENVLGLKLVKQTVNFDDPFTYHLYYGDQQGNPGSILTFFPWQGLPRGKNGNGMVTALAFEVPVGSLDYWLKRLHRNNIETRQNKRFGEEVIEFADPHGLRLELIAAASSNALALSEDDTIPSEYRIKSLHSATTTLRSLQPTQELLTRELGMVLLAEEGNRFRFAMGDGTISARFYDVVVDPEVENSRQGSGTVHHIAFRASDEEQLLSWQRLLRQGGFQVSNVRDRQYFRSIYFHEPGGVLFEIATDPPGFAIDEPLKDLGRSLKLPAQYEARRTEIEKRLPPLRPAAFTHTYKAAQETEQNDITLVALHGTGGDEHDLIPMARQVSNGAAIISPRGRVLEGGMNRFFKRLAPGVFDEVDIVKRAHELADFLLAAAARYDRPPAHLTALGYSNGANIAAAMMLLRPEIFSKAILLRPMLPLTSVTQADLSGKEVLILRGTEDRLIPAHSTDLLIDTLQRFGAEVAVKKIAAGHELSADDLQTASHWLKEVTKTQPAH